MYDDILFPTDGSDASRASFEHAVAMARAFDARLHVLSVINTTYAGVAAGSIDVASLRQSATRILESFDKPATDAGIEYRTELREGIPADEIVAYAAEHCDLIVLGSRGRSGLERYLLGSVAEKVVRTAEVPVLTVHGDVDDEGEDADDGNTDDDADDEAVETDPIDDTDDA